MIFRNSKLFNKTQDMIIHSTAPVHNHGAGRGGVEVVEKLEEIFFCGKKGYYDGIL